MDVYNKAHQLARALQESEVYEAYKKCKVEVEKDSQAKEMLDDYQNSIKKIQEKYMAGEEVTAEEREKIEKKRNVLSLNLLVKDFLDAEHRLGITLMDIQKIISDAVSEKEN